jgi:hypothetical protein
MPIHQRILEAALRICRERGRWTFGPSEIVAALADLNPGSVRTHVMSRCCVNAPVNHPHRWPYFRRVRRGVYEILPAWRRPGLTGGSRTVAPSRRERSTAAAGLTVEVRESGAGYVAEIKGQHGRIRGTSLDDVVTQVRQVERKRGAATSAAPGRLRLQVDLEPEGPHPIIEAYEKDIDRTLVRQALRMGFEERLLALQNWLNDTEELRGASRRRRRSAAG